MAQADLTAILAADTRLAEQAIQKLVSKPYKLNFSVDQGASGALGRIRSQLGEFDKSLAASNARVLAFSASAGAMFAVTKSLKEMVRVTIEVERKMTSINSILGAGRSQFKQFGNDLFKIARDTSTSFEEVADAAEELARQGVGIEETLKRTSSAMKLAKVSGVEVKTAVDAITAALNSNNDAWLDSEKLINKLVAVDAKFAVSAGGLAEAIKRVGSVASDAGLDIDDLIAAITSAQQTTARGEAVIGNALKTIFTRAQRPKVLEDFESLGIATKDAVGNIRPLAGVLTEVAKRYDDLSSAQQQSVSELVGGVYQINILKALFRDLGKETSFFGSALKTSKNATNEADRRVAELNETLDSLFKKLTVNLTQVGSGVGNDVFGPLFKSLLKSANAGLEQVSRDMSGESGQFLGKAFEAIFKGIGNTLNSPILIGGFITISRFLLQTAKEGREAIKTLAGLNNSLHSLEVVSADAANWLRQNPKYLQDIVVASRSAEGATRALAAATAAYNKEVSQRAALDATVGANASAIARAAGIIAIPGRGGTEKLQPKKAAVGLIPQAQEMAGAYAGGYKPGQVRDMNVPGMGRVYYNTAEKVKWFPGMGQPAIMPPQSSRAGRNYERDFAERHGFNPYAAGGMIPNFSSLTTDTLASFGSGKELLKYLKSTGVKGSKGSSRMFIPLDDKRGVKIALNPAGVAQNEVEFPILNNDYFASENYSDILPKGYGFDENNFLWGVVENLKKPTSKDFKNITGKSKREFLIDRNRPSNFIYKFDSKGQRQLVGSRKYSSDFSENEEMIREFASNYGLILNDFYGGRNTGLGTRPSKQLNFFNQEQENIIKLLDIGFTNDVNNRFYGGRGARNLGKFNSGLVPNFAQSITSADTSIKQIPGLFKKFGKQLGPLNIDIGGGKFDLGTDYLNSLGIKSRVYDPFNRSKEFNDETLANFFGKADSATIANVLNVIKEPDARKDLLEFIRKSVKQGGSSYFGIYEGNKSGIGAITSKGFQNNLPAGAYIDEISEFFNIKKKVSNYIIGSPKFNGFVPNFSPLSAAISRESAAVNPGLIRVGSHSALRGPGNPDGVGVYNLRDEPLGLGQGVERARSMGLNPKTHGIPNYASKWEQRKEKVIKDFFGDAGSPESGNKFMYAMSASMAGPMISTMAGGGRTSKIAEEATNALSLYFTLSTFLRGSKGGKVAVGAAAISGIFGAAKQFTNSFNTLDTEIQVLKDNIQKASGGLNKYASTLEQLQESYLNNNVSAEKIGKLQTKLAESLSQLPAELRGQLIGAKSGGQVQEIIGRYTESQDSKLREKEFAMGLSTLLNEQSILRRGSLLGFQESGTKTGKEKLDAIADSLLSSISEAGLKKVGGAAGLGGGDLLSVLGAAGLGGSTLSQLKRVNPGELKAIQGRMVSEQGSRESDVRAFQALAPQRQREIEQAQILEKRMKGARDTIKQAFEQIGQLANLRISIAGRRGLMGATGIGEQMQGVAGLIGETGSPAQAAMANYKAQIAANQIQAASGISNVFGGLRGGISTLFSNTDLSRMGDIPARMRAGQGSLMNILGGSSVSGIGEGAISLFKSLGKDDDTAEIKKLMADSNEKLVEIYQTLEEQNKLAEIQKNIALQRAEFERTLKVGGGLGSFMDRGVKAQQLTDIYSGRFGLQTGIFSGQGSIDLMKAFLGAGGQAGAPGFSKLMSVATESRAQDIISSQQDLNRAFEGTGLSLGVPNLADARRIAETQIAAELKTGDSAMEKQMTQLQAALTNTLSSSMGKQFNNAAQVFANVLTNSNTFIELNSTIDSTQKILQGLDTTLKSLQGAGGYGVRAGGNIPISAAATEKMMAKAGGYNPGYIRRAGNLIYNSAERVDYLPGVREPIISPPPGSLAGFLHRQNFKELGSAAKGNSYLFVPTTSLDEDQIKAIKKAGYNPLDVNAREAYRKGKLSIPKGSRVIDPTMAFTGGSVGWESPLSKSKVKNLSILTVTDPGMTDKLMETRMMKGLPKSEDLVEVLKRHGISTKGKIDIAAHQDILEKEFGKGFFIKAKEGVQSKGVYSQHKLFEGFNTETGTGLRSLEQNKPKIGAKRFFIQSGIPNISERVFRVSTLGTEEGAKVLGKSQIRMVRGSIETDAFAQLYDQGRLVKEGDTLAHRARTGEIVREISKKDLRENLISRRIADAQAKRVMKSLPANLRAGALAGMDVAETGYTGVMKRLQLLAEESGIGYSLFKGGGVIEPNFSDRLGYSGALQKGDLSVEVAKELESLEKSRTSSPVISQNVSSPVKKTQLRDFRGRFIGKPKPVMGSQLNVGLNTTSINSGIKLGQTGYHSPRVGEINFEGGFTPAGDYKPGISDQGYRPSSAKTLTSSQIGNLRKLAVAKKIAENGMQKVGMGLGAAGVVFGGYELGKGIFGGFGEGAKSGDIGQVGMETYSQAMGAFGLLQAAGAAGIASPALGAVGATVGTFGATAGLIAAGGLAMGQTIRTAYDAKKAQQQEREAYRAANLSEEQVAKMKESGQLEKSHVWKGIERGKAGTLKNMTYWPRALGRGAMNLYQGAGGLFDNAAIQHFFGGGNLDSPAEKAARDAYNPGKYYRNVRESRDVALAAARQYAAQEAYKATSGTRFQQQSANYVSQLSPQDRVGYFSSMLEDINNPTRKFGHWGGKEDYEAGMKRAQAETVMAGYEKRGYILSDKQREGITGNILNKNMFGQYEKSLAMAPVLSDEQRAMQEKMAEGRKDPVKYNAEIIAKMFGISDPEQMKRLQIGVQGAMNKGDLQGYVKSFGKSVAAAPAAAPQESQKQAAGNKSEISVNVNMGGNLGVKNTSVEFSEEQYMIINSIVAEVAKGIEEKVKAIVQQQPAEVRSSVASATPPTNRNTPRATPYGV